MTNDISSPQIKAALALLSWNYNDLAKASKISKPTIARFLAGNHNLQKDKKTALISTLIKRDIQFLPNNGVAQHKDYIKKFTGQNSLNKLLDDVYETVKEGGEICVSGVNEALFDKYHKEEIENEHANRMTAIKNTLTFRVILEYGDTNYPYDSYIEYRWMPKGNFHDTPFYAYNNKLAFLKMTSESPEIILFEQSSMSAAFKNLFNVAWEQCIKPEEKNKNAKR